jgi:hypothetical protein
LPGEGNELARLRVGADVFGRGKDLLRVVDGDEHLPAVALTQVQVTVQPTPGAIQSA